VSLGTLCATLANTVPKPVSVLSLYTWNLSATRRLFVQTVGFIFFGLPAIALMLSPWEAIHDRHWRLTLARTAQKLFARVGRISKRTNWSPQKVLGGVDFSTKRLFRRHFFYARVWKDLPCLSQPMAHCDVGLCGFISQISVKDLNLRRQTLCNRVTFRAFWKAYAVILCCTLVCLCCWDLLSTLFREKPYLLIVLSN